MPDFPIDPPIRVRGRPDIELRSLDQAVAFMRGRKEVVVDRLAPGVLHRLESASDETDAKIAADALRAWLEQHDLLG